MPSSVPDTDNPMLEEEAFSRDVSNELQQPTNMNVDNNNNTSLQDGTSTLGPAAATADAAMGTTAEDTAQQEGGDIEAPTTEGGQLKAPPEAILPQLPANNDDDDAPLMSLKSKSTTASNKPVYYAVRVGYAVSPSYNNNEGGEGSEEGTTPTQTHVSTIRSAIFLQWEDVQNFVEFTTQSNNESTVNEDGVRITPFHHNVEYKTFHDIEKAERYLKKVIPSLSNTTGKKKKKSVKKAGKTKAKSNSWNKLHNSSTNLYYPPPKNFNPPTKKWEALYAKALEYKELYDENLDSVPMEESDVNYAEHEELSKWIKYQRTSYRYYLEDPMGGRHSMTEEKVNRLKDAGFSWIVSDKKKWLAEEIGSGNKKKRGRPRKSLEDRGMPKAPKPIRAKWMNMYDKLKEYKEKYNTIEISPDETQDEDLMALRTWAKNQKNMHIRWRQGHDVGMTQEKSDMLKELGMDFPPAWEDMYVKIVQYKAQHGNIEIASDYDPILAAWMARQNEVLGRHLQGKSTRLSDDQAMRLLALGFQGGRGGAAAVSGIDGKVNVTGKTVASRDFDVRWNEMYQQLREWKAEHGHCNVSTTSGTDLAHWVSAQRRMYNKLVAGTPGKRAVLDALKMQRLTEIGFQFRPRGSYVSWDDNIKLVEQFRKDNGHCRIPVAHPQLGSFVKLVRRDYKNFCQGKKTSMTSEREAQLRAYDFIFEGGKTPQRAAGPKKAWSERLEELIQYKNEFGHTVVPQNSGQLGAWVHSQRVHYKKYKEGSKSQMTAERALKLTEIGFCFNASDRYRGNKRHKTSEQEAEEEAILQQQQIAHLQQQQQQQLQETLYVPQHQGVQQHNAHTGDLFEQAAHYGSVEGLGV